MEYDPRFESDYGSSYTSDPSNRTADQIQASEERAATVKKQLLTITILRVCLFVSLLLGIILFYLSSVKSNRTVEIDYTKYSSSSFAEGYYSVKIFDIDYLGTFEKTEVLSDKKTGQIFSTSSNGVFSYYLASDEYGNQFALQVPDNKNLSKSAEMLKHVFIDGEIKVEKVPNDLYKYKTSLFDNQYLNGIDFDKLIDTLSDSDSDLLTDRDGFSDFLDHLKDEVGNNTAVNELKNKVGSVKMLSYLEYPPETKIITEVKYPGLSKVWPIFFVVAAVMFIALIVVNKQMKRI